MEFNDLCKILINTAVYAPFVAGLLIAVLYPFVNDKSSKMITILASCLSLISAMSLWGVFINYEADTLGLSFVSVCDMLPFMPNLGLNAVSMPMFALSAIVGFAAVVWAAKTEISNAKFYLLLLMIMQGGLMGAFSSTNVLMMYMFHEFALIPTFIAMVVWGGAGSRKSAMQMAIYLTLGALLSLAGIIALHLHLGTRDFSMLEFLKAISVIQLSDNVEYIIFGMLLFGLGTLVSLFPFYSWAPRTYASAPTSFAMLHAGVLKKFGLYLLIQFALPLLGDGCVQWAGVLSVLALFNVIFIGIVTMAQRDLKLMISYSSVAHMGLCFLAIASTSIIGVGGAILLMFGHGVSVALLLMLSNAIVNKTGQWDMNNMGGLYKQTPVLASMFLAGTLASLGLPGFANFWGEMSILVSLWNFSPVVCALATTGIIISAIYGLRAFAKVFMGEPSEKISADFSSITDLNLKEKIPAIVLILALLFVGFYPKSITEGLNVDLSNISVLTTSK